MHICKGRDIPYGRCIYKKGEDIVLIRKLYSVCFLVGFMVLWVMLCILIASCLYVGLAYILMLLCFIDWMFGWSFALRYDHCGHSHMTVICLIKLLICFTLCLLDCNLLVTLYLSFYHLIYLEGLMCFVQVFQVTGIYVPSASQLLDLGVSEFCHCSQTHI